MNLYYDSLHYLYYYLRHHNTVLNLLHIPQDGLLKFFLLLCYKVVLGVYTYPLITTSIYRAGL